MFTNSRAPAGARTTKLDLRSTRSRTRRRLHDPRPAVSHETRKRIGQWKAEIKEAAKARHIRPVDRLYADELLAFPSVIRGHYSLASDATMGQRLDVSDSTARRRRRRLDKAGLIKVLGYGRDGNSCLVRPILRDGTPVFPDPEMPTRPVTSAQGGRSILTTDLSKETLRTEEPPLPPTPEPDVPTEGEDQVPQPASPVAAAPPERATDERRSPLGSAAPADAEAAVEPTMTFLEFWLAIGQTGPEGYARAKWAKLSTADKGAIRDRLSRPRSWATDMWAGKWLECRVWEEATPADRPAQVHIREGTAEWRAWQKHLMATRGRGTPIDGRGGWHFATKLPPLPPQPA